MHSFEYAAPETLPEALALLREHGEEARVLAGGQSLVPILNYRLAKPRLVLDINALPLGDVAMDDGRLRLGALVRHHQLEESDVVRQRCPVLAEAARLIGNVRVRSLGTVGGSLAHADPAAELPAALLALDARLHMSGPRGDRVVHAGEFFRGLMATALGADEILDAVEVPAAGAGWAFAEIARRPGDFALAGVAVVLDRPLTLPSPLRGEGLRVVGFGVGDRPLRLRSAEQLLAGVTIDADTAARAGAAVGSDCDPPSDVHGSADYRRHLATVLTERALIQAAARLAGAA